jgi:lysozyme
VKTNQAGIDLIKKFEGCRLESYICPAGKWTIGYGTTKGITSGMKISEAIAETFLKEDLEKFELQLNSLRLHLTDNQFSALVCFVYNVGFGNFSNSTLKKKVQTNHNDPAIRNEFLRWNKAGGKVLPGLVTRRTAEAELYFTP